MSGSFGSRSSSLVAPEQIEMEPSTTANTTQKNWQVPTEFPFCPQAPLDWPLFTYAQNLVLGKVFSRKKYASTTVYDFALSDDEKVLWILAKSVQDNPIKPWLLAQVTYEDQVFVHVNHGSYFDQNGAQKQFALACGTEWSGGDSFDDYC